MTTAAEWIEESVADAKELLDTWEDQGRAAMFLALHRERVQGIANCVEHDLYGPLANGIVFASCTKCDLKRKVRVVSMEEIGTPGNRREYWWRPRSSGDHPT